MVKCVVSGCPNRTANGNRVSFSRKPKRFFNLPKEPARVKVWLAALRETDKQDLSEQQLICEDHFLPEDISVNGVAGDAIPIMPPCLDGPMGLISPWEADSSEEEEPFDKDDNGDDEAPPAPDHPPKDPGGGLVNPPEAEKTSPPQEQKKPSIQSRPSVRADVSLAVLTQRFLQLLLEAPDGSVDLKQVTARLQTGKRRVYDIINVLNGIRLIEKESVNRVKWIGTRPISSFLWRSKNKFQRELDNLKLVEATLDSLIKSCAKQLFDMTDDVANSAFAYVAHEDVRRLQTFQEQTVIIVKAPEETKLEIPVPTEDSIQVHLKAGRGPITVGTCEVESGDAVTSDPGFFLRLEQSRIRTTQLLRSTQ